MTLNISSHSDQMSSPAVTTRWRAALIHLGISVSIGLAALALLYFVYYPEPYFSASGADQLVLILLAVDVMLGPLLTLVVFKSGKKRLKLDLAIIAFLQLAALIYGLSIMWRARPVFIVGSIDRYVIVYASDLDAEDLTAAPPAYQKLPLFGPQLVGATLPSDPAEQQRIAEQAMNGGKDVEKIPKFYVPFEQAKAALLARAKPLKSLQKDTNVAKYLAQNQNDSRYLPLVGRLKSISVVIDANTAQPIKGFDVDPW